ncbi:MAG TPA: hypothetical protein PLB02_05750 [Thermoanaerobaculia bacterium]|nr:hypothetical protein [Thermoanaerobaculia bacterium]HQR66880.1 hypothetical protein [Thermoanaerobaculia bacterium]
MKKILAAAVVLLLAAPAALAAEKGAEKPSFLERAVRFLTLRPSEAPASHLSFRPVGRAFDEAGRNPLGGGTTCTCTGRGGNVVPGQDPGDPYYDPCDPFSPPGRDVQDPNW